MWKSNVSKSKVQTKFELDQFLDALASLDFTLVSE